MHQTHIAFYERYLKIINDELRNKEPSAYSMKIKPKEVIKVCCELPIWSITSEGTSDIVYMIFPTSNYYMNKNIRTMKDAIGDGESVDISVISDPHTGVKCFLHFNR